MFPPRSPTSTQRKTGGLSPARGVALCPSGKGGRPSALWCLQTWAGPLGPGLGASSSVSHGPQRALPQDPSENLLLAPSEKPEGKLRYKCRKGPHPLGGLQKSQLGADGPGQAHPLLLPTGGLGCREMVGLGPVGSHGRLTPFLRHPGNTWSRLGQPGDLRALVAPWSGVRVGQWSKRLWAGRGHCVCPTTRTLEALLMGSPRARTLRGARKALDLESRTRFTSEFCHLIVGDHVV